MRNNINSTGSGKLIKALFGVLILAAFVIIALELTNTTHFFHKTASSSASTDITSAKVSKPGKQAPSTSNKPNNGGVTDNKGQTSGTAPSQSKWTSSNSGNITLQQPYPGQTVKSGSVLSGTAKVSSVQFILVDNSVGQIAKGNLSVVNGKFSGVMNFTAHSKNGKLEVYYPDPNTGAEKDIINIDVNF